MHQRDHQKWVELFHAALLELERAKMMGRIGDARSAIASRLEQLHTLPDLHTEERNAIADALAVLRSLEREQQVHEAHERRVAEEALEKLKVVAQRFGTP
ncbi:MAG TPA: hypothetical protein VJQ82_20685 [Terriglobales bacterium]|nr:hypothetical protein [Terriglobales bacterium]